MMQLNKLIKPSLKESFIYKREEKLPQTLRLKSQKTKLQQKHVAALHTLHFSKTVASCFWMHTYKRRLKGVNLFLHQKPVQYMPYPVFEPADSTLVLLFILTSVRTRVQSSLQLVPEPALMPCKIKQFHLLLMFATEFQFGLTNKTAI